MEAAGHLDVSTLGDKACMLRLNSIIKAPIVAIDLHDLIPIKIIGTSSKYGIYFYLRNYPKLSKS